MHAVISAKQDSRGTDVSVRDLQLKLRKLQAGCVACVQGHAVAKEAQEGRSWRKAFFMPTPADR